MRVLGVKRERAMAGSDRSKRIGRRPSHGAVRGAPSCGEVFRILVKQAASAQQSPTKGRWLHGLHPEELANAFVHDECDEDMRAEADVVGGPTTPQQPVAEHA